MTDIAETLMQRIGDLQDQLEAEFDRRRRAFHFRVEKRRVVFEEAIARRQAELKRHLWSYLRAARPRMILTAPVIYSLILPLALLDAFVSLYQAVCFPVYGIDKVSRRDFIFYDHRHLAYLNGIEKLNCLYCSYANGLLAYVREIAARTERFWCPIKHAQRPAAQHRYYPGFAEYGDAETYRCMVATDAPGRAVKGPARPEGSSPGRP